MFLKRLISWSTISVCGSNPVVSKNLFLYFASFQLIRTWILMNRFLMNRILMNRILMKRILINRILMNWVDDLPIWWFQPSCFQDLCVVVSISYTWPRISFLADTFGRWFEPGRLSNIFFSYFNS